MTNKERALLLRNLSKGNLKLIEAHNYEANLLERIDNWVGRRVFPFLFGMACVVIIFNIIRYFTR